MGSTKTYREGPSWQGKNSNRGAESAYSKGPGVVRPEGTHMSGDNEAKSKMRNVASGTRNKTKASEGPGFRAKTTYGQS